MMLLTEQQIGPPRVWWADLFPYVLAHFSGPKVGVVGFEPTAPTTPL